jgi:hypothetical protein
MEANFAKQTKTPQQQNQAMQNKIILLERQSRFQPRGNANGSANWTSLDKLNKIKWSQLFKLRYDLLFVSFLCEILS